MKAQIAIREWLDAEGRKQRWLARKAGITDADMSRILSIKRPMVPSEARRERLRAATGLDVADESDWK